MESLGRRLPREPSFRRVPKAGQGICTPAAAALEKPTDGEMGPAPDRGGLEAPSSLRRPARVILTQPHPCDRTRGQKWTL